MSLKTFSGEPCKKGHVIRYVSDKSCAECRNISRKAYRKKRPDKRRESNKKYTLRHPERIASKNRNWQRINRDKKRALDAARRRTNPDVYRLRRIRWKKANPDAVRTEKRLRRGRKSGAAGFHKAIDTSLILAAQGGGCAYCGVSNNLHLDHMIPLVRGGSNWPWNLQWLCGFHNLSKGYLTDAEYRAKLGLPREMPVSVALWGWILFV